MSFTPSCFKSCKVQFEHQPSSRCKSPDRGFNSSKVQFERFIRCLKTLKGTRFNSSKVQFELKMDNNEKMPFEVSIPVWCNLNYRWGGCCQGCFCVSIPVRCNLNKEFGILLYDCILVSIPVRYNLNFLKRISNAGGTLGFNSSKVQFEPYMGGNDIIAPQVSIPARYNLNKNAKHKKASFFVVSIPARYNLNARRLEELDPCREVSIPARYNLNGSNTII